MLKCDRVRDCRCRVGAGLVVVDSKWGQDWTLSISSGGRIRRLCLCVVEDFVVSVFVWLKDSSLWSIPSGSRIRRRRCG